MTQPRQLVIAPPPPTMSPSDDPSVISPRKRQLRRAPDVTSFPNPADDINFFASSGALFQKVAAWLQGPAEGATAVNDATKRVAGNAIVGAIKTGATVGELGAQAVARAPALEVMIGEEPITDPPPPLGEAVAGPLMRATLGPGTLLHSKIPEATIVAPEGVDAVIQEAVQQGLFAIAMAPAGPAVSRSVSGLGRTVLPRSVGARVFGPAGTRAAPVSVKEEFASGVGSGVFGELAAQANPDSDGLARFGGEVAGGVGVGARRKIFSGARTLVQMAREKAGILSPEQMSKIAGEMIRDGALSQEALQNHAEIVRRRLHGTKPHLRGRELDSEVERITLREVFDERIRAYENAIDAMDPEVAAGFSLTSGEILQVQALANAEEHAARALDSVGTFLKENRARSREALVGNFRRLHESSAAPRLRDVGVESEALVQRMHSQADADVNALEAQVQGLADQSGVPTDRAGQIERIEMLAVGLSEHKDNMLAAASRAIAQQVDPQRSVRVHSASLKSRLRSVVAGAGGVNRQRQMREAFERDDDLRQLMDLPDDVTLRDVLEIRADLLDKARSIQRAGSVPERRRLKAINAARDAIDRWVDVGADIGVLPAQVVSDFRAANQLYKDQIDTFAASGAVRLIELGEGTGRSVTPGVAWKAAFPPNGVGSSSIARDVVRALDGMPPSATAHLEQSALFDMMQAPVNSRFPTKSAAMNDWMSRYSQSLDVNPRIRQRADEMLAAQREFETSRARWDQRLGKYETRIAKTLLGEDPAKWVRQLIDDPEGSRVLSQNLAALHWAPNIVPAIRKELLIELAKRQELAVDSPALTRKLRRSMPEMQKMFAMLFTPEHIDNASKVLGLQERFLERGVADAVQGPMRRVLQEPLAFFDIPKAFTRARQAMNAQLPRSFIAVETTSRVVNTAGKQAGREIMGGILMRAAVDPAFARDLAVNAVESPERLNRVLAGWLGAVATSPERQAVLERTEERRGGR